MSGAGSGSVTKDFENIQIRVLRDRIKEIEDQLAKALKDKSDKDELIKKLQEVIARLNAENLKLRQDLDVRFSAMAAQKAETLRVSEILYARDAQIAELNQEIGRLSEILYAGDAQIAELNQEIGCLSEILYARDAQIAELNQKMEPLTIELQGCRKSVTVLTERCKDLDQQNRQLSKALSVTAFERRSLMDEENSKRMATIGELNIQVGELSLEVHSLRQALESRERDLAEVRAQALESIEGKLAETSSLFARIEAQDQRISVLTQKLEQKKARSSLVVSLGIVDIGIAPAPAS